MSYDLLSVAARMKVVRKAKGIKSQTAMAKLIDAEINQYNNWERGVALMPVGFGIRFAALTGASLDYLYLGDMSNLPLALAEFIQKDVDISKDVAN